MNPRPSPAQLWRAARLQHERSRKIAAMRNREPEARDPTGFLKGAA